MAEKTLFVCILYYKSCIHGHKLRLYGHDPTQIKSFFKNREKPIKIDSKWNDINYLHFSQGREKAVKISDPIIFMKKAGQAIKRKLNVVLSMTSVSHKMRGTSVGQAWDTGQAGYAKFFKNREKIDEKRT